MPWSLATRAGLALSLAVALAPAPASACVTCGAGDPTLTVMGAEPPLAGRGRVSLGVSALWDRVGDVSLAEGRADLALSVAPTDWLTLSASTPLVLRAVSEGPHGRFLTVGPGDTEVRARVVWLRDRAWAPSHVFGPTLGVRAPTSLDHADGQGLLPVDAQSGSGAFAAMPGLQYAWLVDPWSVFVSATVTLPFAGRYADTPGPSFATTTAAQYRFDRALTVRAAVDTRLDAPATLAGRTDPRSDHFSLFVSPELLWSPAGDWILQLGVRVPVLQVSEQGREEGWTVRAALTVDAEL